MGAEQEKWLLDGFNNSTQRWDILGQQVFGYFDEANASAADTGPLAKPILPQCTGRSAVAAKYRNET